MKPQIFLGEKDVPRDAMLHLYIDGKDEPEKFTITGAQPSTMRIF